MTIKEVSGTISPGTFLFQVDYSEPFFERSRFRTKCVNELIRTKVARNKSTGFLRESLILTEITPPVFITVL